MHVNHPEMIVGFDSSALICELKGSISVEIKPGWWLRNEWRFDCDAVFQFTFQVEVIHVNWKRTLFFTQPRIRNDKCSSVIYSTSPVYNPRRVSNNFRWSWICVLSTNFHRESTGIALVQLMCFFSCLGFQIAPQLPLDLAALWCLHFQRTAMLLMALWYRFGSGAKWVSPASSTDKPFQHQNRRTPIFRSSTQVH